MTPLEDDFTSPLAGGPPGEAPAPAPEVPPTPARFIPEDLRVPWSWTHLFFFLLFGFGVSVVVPGIFAAYFYVARHMNIDQVQKLLTTNTPLIILMQSVIFGLLFLFFYVTIVFLHRTSFWFTIGWRPFHPKVLSPGTAARLSFAAGCGLAIANGIASVLVHPKGKLPIQELFKDRTGTFLVMGFAVLVAPLVEETIFRGYLYPVLARGLGVPAGVVITGILFGLLHAPQLGNTWALVALIMTVGIIFTYVRARTGTVFASYLCHLGYNFTLFFFSALATRGFSRLPPGA